ncbi:MAG: hypothetical protein ACRC0V_00755 [Fusobacteriaceae bacterium]
MFRKVRKGIGTVARKVVKRKSSDIEMTPLARRRIYQSPASSRRSSIVSKPKSVQSARIDPLKDRANLMKAKYGNKPPSSKLLPSGKQQDFVPYQHKPFKSAAAEAFPMNDMNRIETLDTLLSPSTSGRASRGSISSTGSFGSLGPEPINSFDVFKPPGPLKKMKNQILNKIGSIGEKNSYKPISNKEIPDKYRVLTKSNANLYEPDTPKSSRRSLKDLTEISNPNAISFDPISSRRNSTLSDRVPRGGSMDEIIIKQSRTPSLISQASSTPSGNSAFTQGRMSSDPLLSDEGSIFNDFIFRRNRSIKQGPNLTPKDIKYNEKVRRTIKERQRQDARKAAIKDNKRALKELKEPPIKRQKVQKDNSILETLEDNITSIDIPEAPISAKELKSGWKDAKAFGVLKNVGQRALSIGEQALTQTAATAPFYFLANANRDTVNIVNNN